MTTVRRLLALLVAGVLGFGSAGCTPLGGGTITVTAMMADSAGLFVGNDVGVLGVTVGTVDSIKPAGDHVEVVLEIDADQPVPAGAGAVVVARSVATDRYVELTPVWSEGPQLADGAVIPLDRTRTPVDFDDVLGALNTFATGIAGQDESAGAIKRLLDAGSEALDGNGELMNRAITGLGGAVNAMHGQRQNFTSTIESLDALTGTIAENRDLVEEFVGQVSSASRLLADERENFDAALRSLGDAVELVAEFAKDNRAQVVTSLDEASAVMDTLMSKRDQLTETLQVMPVTLENLQRILDDGRLKVMADPLVLTPLGGLVNDVCQSLPTDYCAEFGPVLLNLQHVLDLILGGLP